MHYLQFWNFLRKILISKKFCFQSHLHLGSGTTGKENQNQQHLWQKLQQQKIYLVILKSKSEHNWSWKLNEYTKFFLHSSMNVCLLFLWKTKICEQICEQNEDLHGKILWIVGRKVEQSDWSPQSYFYNSTASPTSVSCKHNIHLTHTHMNTQMYTQT